MIVPSSYIIDKLLCLSHTIILNCIVFRIDLYNIKINVWGINVKRLCVFLMFIVIVNYNFWLQIHIILHVEGKNSFTWWWSNWTGSWHRSLIPEEITFKVLVANFHCLILEIVAQRGIINSLYDCTEEVNLSGDIFLWWIYVDDLWKVEHIEIE